MPPSVQGHEEKLTPSDEQHDPLSNVDAGSAGVGIGSHAERRLLWKLDFALLPLFALIYCLNFIDRTAIGNAKIAGLEHDLGMQGFDYNIALTIFYIFYILFDIPSNLAVKRYGSIWIALLVTCFGAATIGTAFVKNYNHLIATRIFLGMAEGGTLSGLAYLLSRYYRRDELVLRMGIFYGTSPTLAGAFGGLIASGLLSIDDIGTVKSWRKIFLVEGIITTCVGLLGFFFFPDDPQRTRLLNEKERALALARLDADQVVKMHGKKERTTWRLVGRSFNINTSFYTMCYFLVNISFQGLSLFMPTVISTLGHYSKIESQLRTVPPYLFGMVWALMGVSLSYWAKSRVVPILISLLLMVIGYAIAIGTENPHARYAACFFSIAGGSPVAPILVAWGADNAAPETIRAMSTAIIPGFGAFGAVLAVWTYLPADAPNYHKGNSINLATSSLAFVLMVFAGLYVRWENGKRERGERDHRLDEKTVEEIRDLGYLHPEFRYQM